MSKIVPMALVQSMSGKVCMHSDVYFRTNKRTGDVYSGKMCYPYEGEPTENQVAVRTAFTAACASAKAICAAKSTDSDQALYTKQQAYRSSYDGNRTFKGNFYSFVVKKEYQAAQD
ncbi:MAG: hypothetical protein MJZ82_05735 [Paludibacteraceae bacterium]|nr:hypothetical protein [Paludibacteraceae bacterium]